MKETRFFYVPNASISEELPEEEALHALRVLRLNVGDEIVLMDGCGKYYNAEVTFASNKRCVYKILEEHLQKCQWARHYHIAIAPTKMMERMEWMVEKATEIGIDEFSFLNCKFSERRIIKLPRIDKIVISAIKQSHKAWKPQVNDMIAFKQFISTPRAGLKFIAHCYTEIPRKYFFDELKTQGQMDDVTVLIGPEGDFSIEEVRLAIDKGYVPVHLGESRFRTETAAIAALMMMQLSDKLNGK